MKNKITDGKEVKNMDAKEVIKANVRHIQEIALRLEAVRQPGDLRLIGDLLMAMVHGVDEFRNAWQKEVDAKEK
jgi:hypothetical protein